MSEDYKELIRILSVKRPDSIDNNYAEGVYKSTDITITINIPLYVTKGDIRDLIDSAVSSMEKKSEEIYDKHCNQ